MNHNKKGLSMLRIYQALIVGLALLFGACGDAYYVGMPGPQGSPGVQGKPGEDAIAEVIDPCGDAAGIYDEVVLRLNTGQLLASFSDNSNGKNTRFVLLTPGSYITTDGSNCHFTVTSDFNVVW